MYCTMIIDSQTGLPLWIRTGICLWTGFIFNRKGLLLFKFSSLSSYSTPFSANAILTLIPNGLDQKSNKITSSAILRSFFAQNNSWVFCFSGENRVVFAENKVSNRRLYLYREKVWKELRCCRILWQLFCALFLLWCVLVCCIFEGGII